MTNSEFHSGRLSDYLKDLVYGATDGIITTFAIVTGSIGADFSTKVIIILGIANLLADGFSMAASNFLGSHSESARFRREERREIKEVAEMPDKEKEEVETVLKESGFDAASARQMTNIIATNHSFWVDFMMRYELKMNVPSDHGAWRGALATFLAFVAAGSLPLLPFLLFKVSPEEVLVYSAAATGAALFAVGAARRLVTGINWFISGLEVLAIGGIAALVSYGVGALISILV